MPLTPSDISYLESKHRGGSSFAKGGKYEQYYMVFLISNLLRRYEPDVYGNIKIETQVPHTFVDDIVITLSDSHKQYYQLKNVQDLTWKSGSSHTIEYDFSRQEEISKENGEDFELSLIYSDSSNEKIKTIPTGLTKTSVEWFPYAEDVNNLMWSSSEFYESVSGIADPLSTRDDKIAIVTMFLGVCLSVDMYAISLDKIVDCVHDNYGQVIKLKKQKTYQLKRETELILKGIENLEYKISGDILYLNYGRWNSNIKLSDRVEEIISTENPQDFVELNNLLLKCQEII